MISQGPENPISLFWFRRDLRLEDNHGLYKALKDKYSVLSFFIFDKNILNKLQDKCDLRINFIYKELLTLKRQLENLGSSLLVKFGYPEEIFKELLKDFHITSVYLNHDYEPYATDRDEIIRKLLKDNNIGFFNFKDQVIFEKTEILKSDLSPYSVFTPYMRKWKETLKENIDLNAYHPDINNLLKIKPLHFLTIIELGFHANNLKNPSKEIDADIITNYHKTRDLPYLDGTSKLGVHLRFGTISIRKLIKISLQLNPVFLNELIWREFFMMILWHYPHVVEKSFRPKYERIKWRNNENEFLAWCEGKTGYPIVDAGMRELNQTGFMHNRVRMITAGFLTKHLLIDWRWGEAYFAEKLLDFELSSNNGNWQWAAGTGCDAAPYFRIFSPDAQQKKFDPKLEYVKKWIPEYGTSKYPKPIVEHKFARERALHAYKSIE